MEYNQLEKRKEQIQELLEVTERYLDLKRWKFHLTFSEVVAGFPPRIIYDSEWCRVMFSHEGWDPLAGKAIAVYYGRLHAATDKFTIVWDGDKCPVGIK